MGCWLLFAHEHANNALGWRRLVHRSKSQSRHGKHIAWCLAVSSDYVWAVGSSDNESLILKWNGVEWSRTVSPSRPNGANYGADISAVSPNLARATGYSSSADASYS